MAGRIDRNMHKIMLSFREKICYNAGKGDSQNRGAARPASRNKGESDVIPCAKYERETAVPAHGGTIFGAEVIPEGIEAPFRHFYGYLENGHAMEGHAHDTDEIYIILKGRGTVIVGGLCRDVEAGDVVTIPAGVWHTQLCRDGGPYLWAAFWWEKIPEGRKLPEGEIQVKRFVKEKAFPSHNGSILADWGLPEGLTAPFESAYGLLEPDGAMEGHRHHTMEVYLGLRGEGKLTVNGEETVMRPGDICAILPDAWHELSTVGDEDFLWLAWWWNVD